MDIVERLRVNMHAYGIAQEAAAEIERLRAEVAEVTNKAQIYHMAMESRLHRAEAAETESDLLRESIVRIRAHTAFVPFTHRDVLAGLLAIIERIADAALKDGESKLSRAVKMARGGEAPPLPFNAGAERKEES